MTTDAYWQQQSADTPLFPDILWSRPETKQGAGKLLIVGGNSFGFAAPGQAFVTATKAGIGVCRVLLPEALRKTIGSHMAEADFAPNNPSGSFSKNALEPLLTNAMWANATLLAGELGRNSETAVTLETFVKRYRGPLTVTRDATDYFLKTPSDVLDRPETMLVVSFEQLQKLALHSHFEVPLLFSMGTALTASWLHEFSLLHRALIVMSHDDQFFVAKEGRVVTQKNISDEKIWRVTSASRATVFWLQNPAKAFESVVTSLTN